MIHDVAQKGRIRAAQGKTDILLLCKEMGMNCQTVSGNVLGIDSDDGEVELIYGTGDWMIVNIDTGTWDIVDDELFRDEFLVMQ